MECEQERKQFYYCIVGMRKNLFTLMTKHKIARLPTFFLPKKTFTHIWSHGKCRYSSLLKIFLIPSSELLFVKEGFENGSIDTRWQKLKRNRSHLFPPLCKHNERGWKCLMKIEKRFGVLGSLTIVKIFQLDDSNKSD